MRWSAVSRKTATTKQNIFIGSPRHAQRHTIYYYLEVLLARPFVPNTRCGVFIQRSDAQRD